MRLTKGDREQAVEAFRALLAAVDTGELEADTPQAKRVLRRLEGGLAALEAQSAKGGHRE